MNTETALKLSELRNEPAWLAGRRKEAAKAFEKLPAPEFRYGMRIFHDIDLNLSSMDPLSHRNEDIIKAPEDVVVLDFTEAIKDYEDLIRDNFMSTMKDKIAAMHSAFFTNALFILIPSNKTIKEPIRINNRTDGKRIDNILIIAEENSSAAIIDSCKGDCIRSHITELIAEENAQISYISIQNCKDAIYLSRKRAEVMKNASVKWFDCNLGSSFAKSDISSVLKEEGASSYNAGLFFGSDDRKLDLFGKVIHEAPHTDSDMLVRGICTGKAKTIFRGLIKIDRNAHDCSGFQREDALLLSETAEVDAVPMLEINNDDVQCSHGTSVGQVDKEKLFYLMSRGLSHDEAEHMITEGFFQPLLKKLDDNLAEEVKSIIFDQLKKVTS
ncbi:MAG: Fe-S cluster assembly protein SufD [Candidatus Nanoarchaeia archaeon]